MTKCNKAKNKNKIKWVSELIKDDYQKWESDKVLLGCGTGRGKTTFALGTYCKYLLSHGHKVLYLCNRIALQEQIEGDITKYGVDDIDRISYQGFANFLKKGENLESLQYDVYICDEAHYFLSDSEFNLYTDIAYDFLINAQNATVVFMTATYKNIFEKIKSDVLSIGQKSPIEYILPTDYSYVESIYWFKQKDLYGIIEKILKETDDKIMYFCNSIKKMESLYNHYSPTRGTDIEEDKKIKNKFLEDMVFLCSGNTTNNKFAKKNGSDESVIKKDFNTGGYTFEKRVLVTTKVLDNGVDFKDKRIKHIICDVFDLESAIQCLGRKRVMDDTDTCIFYIRDYKHNELNIFHKKCQDELEPVNLFIRDKEQWIKKYGKDREHNDKTIFFDFDIKNDWQINDLRYKKLLSDEDLIRKMKYKKTTYKSEILCYLGYTVAKKSKKIEEIKRERIKDAIEIFLESHVDKILSDKEKDSFINVCNLRDSFNRQQRSIGVLNQYLENNIDYPYIISSERVREDGKRVRKWIIRKKIGEKLDSQNDKCNEIIDNKGNKNSDDDDKVA